MQKNSKIFAWAILAVLVVAAAVTLLCGGLNLGEAFSGGYLLKIDIEQDFELADLEKIVAGQPGVGDYSVQKAGEKMDQAIIRVQNTEDEGAAITAAVQEQFSGAKFRGCEAITRAVPRMTLVYFVLAGVAAMVVASLYLAVRYGISGGVGAFASSMGTMLLLLALALVARLSINLTMLAAFLAVLLYSFLDVGIYFEQMRGVLRKAGSDDALEAAQEAGKACRLQRVILVIIGVAMFLGALLLGSKALMSFSLCAAAGILISALCTALLGVPASFWAKKAFAKNKKVRKKVKAIK